MNQVASARWTGHTLQVQCGRQIFGFDRTGRFVRRVQPGEVLRRSLNGNLVRVQVTGAGLAARRYEEVNESESVKILDQVYQQVTSQLRAMTTCDGPNLIESNWIELLQGWTVKGLERDRVRFAEAYLPVSILPPGEYQSVVVQITEGCSYNRCLFCDFYRDRPFHIKNDAQLGEHLQGVRDLFGRRLLDRTGVFLGDGNALVIPTARLLHAMNMISDWLPEVDGRFCTFMDTFNLSRKTDEDLRTLRQRGLDTVYIGLETGYDKLRQVLKKPGTAREALAGIQKIKAAGLRVGVIVLAGVGTQEDATPHFNRTLHVLQESALEKRDIVFVSPFVTPENEAYNAALAVRATESPLFTYQESVAEARRWVEEIRAQLPAKVSLYSILEHLY